MSLTKFGAYVHPYQTRLSQKEKLSEVVVGSANKEQFYEFMVPVHGFECVDYIYDGPDGVITMCNSEEDEVSLSINDGERVDCKTVLGETLKKGDLVTIWTVDFQEEVKIFVLYDVGPMGGVMYSLNKSTCLSRRAFKYLMQSGTITHISGEASNLKVNGIKVKSSDSTELTFGDIFTFNQGLSPPQEAYLVIRAPLI